MLKSFIILRKKENVSEEEFVRYMTEEHIPKKVLKIFGPYLKRHTFHHVRSNTFSNLKQTDPPINAIVESWADVTPEKYMELAGSPDVELLVEDCDHLLDRTTTSQHMVIIQQSYPFITT